MRPLLMIEGVICAELEFGPLNDGPYTVTLFVESLPSYIQL